MSKFFYASNVFNKMRIDSLLWKKMPRGFFSKTSCICKIGVWSKKFVSITRRRGYDFPKVPVCFVMLLQYSGFFPILSAEFLSYMMKFWSTHRHIGQVVRIFIWAGKLWCDDIFCMNKWWLYILTQSCSNLSLIPRGVNWIFS